MTTGSENFQVCSVKSYKCANQEFIESQQEGYKLEELEKLLETNNYYNIRIHKKQNYIFFGDLDNYKHSFEDFVEKLISFLSIKYDILIEKKDISYTKNNVKDGSYHYSISKLHCSCEKLKIMHEEFRNLYPDHLKNTENDITSNCIDTTIYSEHWFRLPMQYKGTDGESVHEIIKGSMRDFIVSYIPEYSQNIENKLFISDKIINNISLKAPKIKDNQNKKQSKNLIIEEELKKKKQKMCAEKFDTYKRLFDECYNPERYDVYENWISIGMALKNIYGQDAFGLFDYFSSKSKKYEGSESNLGKFNSFDLNPNKGKGLNTIYKFAKLDNKLQYKKIMNEKENSFSETEFAKKLFELAGDNFIYKKVGDGQYKLCCYTGKYWVWDDIPIRQYITNVLYPYYKNYMYDVFFESKEFKKIQRVVNNMLNLKVKDNIIKIYKEYAIREIKFDDKWWLFGFNNCVYDLQTHSFRDYRKIDYITITTEYDWRDPTSEEINTVSVIINQIMPIKEERDLYLSILSTSLEGRCLEKFIVENGHGRNGKGVMGDLLIKAMGRYGLIANNSILFETNKTGSNPEKANMHKKRFIIFREPPSKNKFENSIIKELTGGGLFSARSHYENNTEKILHCTIVCECNKRPLFAEEPTTAEVERLIDIYFRSTFTDDISLLGQEYHYKGNIEYKTDDFQEKHKFALLKILMDYHVNYSNNNNNFIIPESVKSRTNDYLEMSCFIYQWFKDHFEFTNNDEDKLKIHDVFTHFRSYEHVLDLSRYEKRKYTYKYFLDYFSSNITTKKYYKDRYGPNRERKILLGWKQRIAEDDAFKFEKNHNLD